MKNKLFILTTLCVLVVGCGSNPKEQLSNNVVYELSEVTTHPVPIVRKGTSYNNQYDGATVEVSFIVDPNGNVRDIIVKSSSIPKNEAQELMQQTLLESKYSPAELDDIPVSVLLHRKYFLNLIKI